MKNDMALNLKDIKLKVKNKKRKSNEYENTKFELESVSKKIKNEEPQEDYEEVDVSRCTQKNPSKNKKKEKLNDYSDWNDRKPGFSTNTSVNTNNKIKNQEDNLQLPTVVRRPSQCATINMIKWKFLSIMLILILICVGLAAALTIVLMDSRKGYPCDEYSCLYNGTCSIYDDKAVCSCFNGFSGRMCEVTPCENIKCMNNGACYISDLKAKCACPNGFDGNRCHVTPCSSNPCLHNGVCSYEKGTSRHTCKCKAGFTGSDCEVTPCSNEPCFNGGSCSYTVNSQHHTCRCRLGFSGNNCQVTPCSGNPCSSNGRCIIDNDSFVCYCQDGYSGSHCEASFHRNISSPNYPNYYNDDLDISWNINVGLGNVATLSFINFTTESGYDCVRIYDGQSTTSSKMWEFSGVIGLPTVLTSTGQYMHVTFTTDGSGTRKGFYATIYQKLKS